MVILGFVGILWKGNKNMKHEVYDHEDGGWRWMLMLKNLD